MRRRITCTFVSQFVWTAVDLNEHKCGSHPYFLQNLSVNLNDLLNYSRCHAFLEVSMLQKLLSDVPDNEIKSL